MLAYQHISHQTFGRNSPRSNNNESPLKRSLSPDDVMCRRESQIDYVRHQLRRQSLSRSASPIRSHSPAYTTTSSHLKFANEQHHQIKRSLSEEDLRINHERRRLSSDHKENDRHRDVIISHRPQILMNYQHHHRALKVEENDDNKKISESEQYEASADEPDEDVPLDLSMGNKKQRGRSDSTTDSDDSTGMCDEGRSSEGRAYKKNLMKRYCKFLQESFPYFFYS
jgi:hypothetical protein